MHLEITLGAEDVLSMSNSVIIGFGANIAGRFGDPAASLRHSASLLRSAGLQLEAASGMYETAPVGCGPQPRYINAVAIFQCGLPTARLLSLLNGVERDAGRKRRGINSPRPVDLDILDVLGASLGWQKRGSRMATTPRTGCDLGQTKPHRSPRPKIVVPHPELHLRNFVLVPLVEIAPYWRHRVFDCSARSLLARLPRIPHTIRRVLDSSWCS